MQQPKSYTAEDLEAIVNSATTTSIKPQAVITALHGLMNIHAGYPKLVGALEKAARLVEESTEPSKRGLRFHAAIIEMKPEERRTCIEETLHDYCQRCWWYVAACKCGEINKQG
jgi:hypothetical protein